MEELLLAMLEILGEVFFEIAAEAVADFILRSVRNLIGESKAISPILAAAGYLILGIGFGILSAFLIPHPLMHRSKFHGASLVVSPVLTGLIMSQVGRMLRRRGKAPLQLESFWYGFSFALGVAIIRFLFVS
jgi:hypothetical protein